jgi:hypothetical protein
VYTVEAGWVFVEGTAAGTWEVLDVLSLQQVAVTKVIRIANVK